MLRSVNTLVLLDLVELDGVVLWSVNTLALLDLVHSDYQGMRFVYT